MCRDQKILNINNNAYCFSVNHVHVFWDHKGLAANSTANCLWL